MGIQPIDLQTMYSQLSNVAKQAAHQQQGVQLSESMQQADIVRQNQEHAKKVQQADEQSKLGNINHNGRNSSGQQNGQQQESEESGKDDETSDKPRLKEDYLGQHIDITR